MHWRYRERAYTHPGIWFPHPLEPTSHFSFPPFFSLLVVYDILDLKVVLVLVLISVVVLVLVLVLVLHLDLRYR